jgi:hypothetical protein
MEDTNFVSKIKGIMCVRGPWLTHNIWDFELIIFYSLFKF